MRLFFWIFLSPSGPKYKSLPLPIFTPKEVNQVKDYTGPYRLLPEDILFLHFETDLHINFYDITHNPNTQTLTQLRDLINTQHPTWNLKNNIYPHIKTSVASMNV